MKKETKKEIEEVEKELGRLLEITIRLEDELNYFTRGLDN